MVIQIANKKFHRETMKKINSYYDKSANAYSRGDMVKGKFYEKKADSLYGKSYGKMFGLKRKNNRWVKK
jgi:hypothetical protein